MVEGTALLSAIIPGVVERVSKTFAGPMRLNAAIRELDLGRILRFCHSLQIDSHSD